MQIYEYFLILLQIFYFWLSEHESGGYAVKNFITLFIYILKYSIAFDKTISAAAAYISY